MSNEFTSFRQGEGESLFDAWERFKEMLRQCPHHGIPDCIQIETFYNGLTSSSRNMLDASSGRVLLSKSYIKGLTLIESITTNTYQLPTVRTTSAPTTARKSAGMHEVSKTIVFSAQVAQIPNTMKTLLTPLVVLTVVPVKVVTEVVEATCVYCGAFMQETKTFAAKTKTQIQAQRVSIKNLENQVGQIAIAFSSRPSGTLPSITETPASTSNTKKEETRKVILLRSEKEYEGP
ncbi:hypothetical protein A2U01_0018731, partial [Trifolium medium]|nr:hypothetical protein [Trifolium medium]